jgi:ankyrin repeat protein
MEQRFYDAIRETNFESIRALIKERRVYTIWNPLLYACWQDNLEVARFLLQLGEDPNRENSMGWTPLNFVVTMHRHNPEMARVLVEYGADTNRRKGSVTPLMYAVRNRYLETVKLLIQYGADLSLQNHRGETALSISKDSIRQVLLNSSYP